MNEGRPGAGQQQCDLERLRSENAATQLELREYKDMDQEHGIQIANLQVRMDDLETETAVREDQAAQQIAALEAEREELAERLKDNEARSEELMQERFREIASLTATIERERLQALDLQAAMREAETHHQAVEKKLRSQNGKLKTRVHDLETETAVREEQAAQRIAALEAEREELAQRLKDNEARSEELMQELQHEIASLTATIEKERLQTLDLQAAMREAETRHQAVEKKLRSQNGKLKTRVHDLETETAVREEQAAQRIAALEAEREELAQRLKDNEARSEELMQELQHEIASLTAALEDERLRLLTVQEEHNKLQETLTHEQAEVIFYREQFDLIKGNTFWRVTGPVRRTIDRLRALRAPDRDRK